MKLIFSALFVLILNLSAGVGFSKQIRVAIPSDVHLDYLEFSKNRKMSDVTSFDHPKSRRDVVEVALVMRAFEELGLSSKVEVVEISNYSRILKEIEKGLCFISGTTSWGADMGDAFYNTPSFVKDGEFVAGLYGQKDVISGLSMPIDWSKLTAVSNSQWKSDWGVLQKLETKKVYDVRQWNQMFRMVHSKRVDFLMAPFQKTRDLSLEYDGKKLFPIKGYKVALPGTRKIAVSKVVYPQYPNLQKKIARIFKKYVDSGLVKKAYEDSGWWYKEANSWQLIAR